jgi:hypothetical protein
MDPLATYAAFVATGGLAWQIYSRVTADRTLIEVAVAGTWPFDGPLRNEDHGLSVILVNHSRYDLPMPAVHIYQPSSGIMWPIRDDDPLASLPDTLRARGSQSLTVPIARFEHLQLPEPVVAEALTHTGDSFRSRPTVIAHLLE